MPLSVRKDQEDKGHHGQNDKMGIKSKTGMAVFSVLSEGSCEVELQFTGAMLRSHRHCVLLSPAQGMDWRGKKNSPSFDIQIIFRDSNKKLVPCGPLGSLAATICSSSALSSSVSLLCISSPTECVSAPCYFKANAA